MIKKIVQEINNLNLGITADFGYSTTKDNGIFVSNTFSERLSKHSKGDKLQILIVLSNINDGYLKIRDIAEKIINKMEEIGCIEITHNYIGVYQNRHNYSINLRIGGI